MIVCMSMVVLLPSPNDCSPSSRLLGCFSDTKKLGPTSVFPSNAQPFQRLLEDEAVPGGCAGDSVCPTLKHCSKLFIYLYKMATDSFDRSAKQRPEQCSFVRNIYSRLIINIALNAQSVCYNFTILCSHNNQQIEYPAVSSVHIAPLWNPWKRGCPLTHVQYNIEAAQPGGAVMFPEFVTFQLSNIPNFSAPTIRLQTKEKLSRQSLCCLLFVTDCSCLIWAQIELKIC